MPTSRPPELRRRGDLVPAPHLRLPELAGQRGLAALVVVVFHVYQYDRSGADARYPLQGSWGHPLLLGLDGAVDWFFVLSAFLLTLPFARALQDGTPLPTARTFLGRRAIRILPLYVIAVLVVWTSRNPSLPGDWLDLVEHLTFTQVFDQTRIFFTLGPAWSLAVEMHFYVVLALLGTGLARTAAHWASPARRLTALAGVTAVLGATSIAWAIGMGVVLGRPAVAYPVWFGLPSKLVVFALGMAAAVLVVARPRPLGRPATWALRGAGGGLYLLTCVALQDRTTGTAEWLFHAGCGLAASALVLAGAQGTQDGLWHRLSARGALPWLGLVSYSLYLWHEPLLLALAGRGLLPEPSAAAFLPSTALVVVGSALVAGASYWLVEHPASNLRVLLSPLPDRRLSVPAPRAPKTGSPKTGSPENGGADSGGARVLAERTLTHGSRQP